MKTELFLKVMKTLADSGVRYALLGDTDEYPHNIGGDVDVMVHPDDLPVFHIMMWQCEDSATRVVNRIRHEHAAFCYVFAKVAPGGDVTTLKIDVCADYVRYGATFLRATDVLRDTADARDCDGNPKGFRVLSPRGEFMYYLLKKIYKSGADEAQFTHLLGEYRKDPGGCAEEIGKCWNAKDSLEIRRIFDAGSFGGFVGWIPYFRRNLIKNAGLSLPGRINVARWMADRIKSPTGFVVAASGLSAERVAIMRSDWAETQRSTMSDGGVLCFATTLVPRLRSTFAVCDVAGHPFYADIALCGGDRETANRMILEAMSQRATKRWKPKP